MQATALSYFRLGQWLRTNNCPDVLPFLPAVVTTTTDLPAAFALNVPMSNLYGDEPSRTEFVQVVVSQSIPTDVDCMRLMQTNVPFVMVVTANATHDQRLSVAPPESLPSYTEGEPEPAPEIPGPIAEPLPDQIRIDQSVMNTICDLLVERQAMLQEWVKMNDKHGNRGLEFLKECDGIFIDIATRLANGDVVAPTRAWFSKLQRVVKNLETVSERFLRMQQVVPEPPAPAPSKRYRPVKALDVAAPGLATDSSLVEEQSAGQQPAQGGTGDQKLSEADMDAKLAALPDAMTRFILLALGVSGSAPHRGFRALPTISTVYSSEARVDAYLVSVHPFVSMALRDVEADLSPFMLRRFGTAFRVPMVLRSHNSFLFTLCARLAGLFMRKNLLYSVTRNGYTAHGKLEHQKEVNETLLCLHNIIPNTTDLFLHWDLV